jgi:hypothetical protein
MATHRIHVHPSAPLEAVNADLIIDVSSDDHKLGELRISRGTIDWAHRNAKVPVSLSWEQFDELMQSAAD